MCKIDRRNHDFLLLEYHYRTAECIIRTFNKAVKIREWI